MEYSSDGKFSGNIFVVEKTDFRKIAFGRETTNK